MKRALGIGLVAHGLAGAALHEAPKVADRVERYQARRSAIERHEGFQALRRQIVREAAQEMREGHYRSGHFLIKASAIDLREAGFFPESTSVAEIEREYDQLLTRFQAALQSNRGSLTAEAVTAALAEATEGYNYQGVHGTQLVLLLAEKIGSCDQISQLVMSLLHDSGNMLGGQVQEVGMRVYPPGSNGSGHVAPVARFGEQEIDFTAGDVAYPYGVRIAVNRMPQLYAEQHHLSSDAPSTNRIRARAWRESEEGLEGSVEEDAVGRSAPGERSILNVQSFLLPSADGQEVRPFPGRVPFFGRSIVRRPSSPDSRQGVLHDAESSTQANLDGALESQRWQNAPGLVRMLYEAQLPQQVFIGRDAERLWLQQQGDLVDVSVYQSLTQDEITLLSTLLEDFAQYDADYRARRAAGNVTLPNEITNLVSSAALYRLLALQSRVMGRRQAEAVAHEHLHQLRERIRVLLREVIQNPRDEGDSDLLFVLDYFDSSGTGILPLLDMLEDWDRLDLMKVVMQRIKQAAASATNEGDRNYKYSQSSLLAPFLLTGTAEYRERVLDRWQAELRPIQLSFVLNAVYTKTSMLLNARDVNIRDRQPYGSGTSFRGLELIGQHPLARRFQNLQAFLLNGNFYRSFVLGVRQDYPALRRQLDEFARFANLSPEETRQVKVDVYMRLGNLMADGAAPIASLAFDERLLLAMLADPVLSDPDYRFEIMGALDRLRERQRDN